MSSKLRLIFAGLLVVLLATVAIQNSEVVQLQFLGWTFEVSLILVVLLAGATGMVIGAMLTLATRVRSHRPKG